MAAKNSDKTIYNTRLSSLCEAYRLAPGSPGRYWFVTAADKMRLGARLCPADPKKGAKSVTNWFANRRKDGRRQRYPGGGGAAVHFPPGRPSAAAIQKALADEAASERYSA